MAAKGKSKIRF